MSKRFEVLMSCMYLNDASVIKASNLSNMKTLVINQTNPDKLFEKKLDNGSRILSSVERGISKSRNMALRNSDAEYCLISDDDEWFVDDIENIVVSSFEKHPEVDVMIFKISNFPKGQKNKFYRLKKLDLLKVASIQIAVKRSSLNSLVWFDENLGAGTINKAGEENKFLLDCYKYGLNISYSPVIIGKLRESESTWFNGYNEDYFFTRGKILRYILGFPLTVLYNLYFVITKKALYRKDIGSLLALKCLMKGSFTKDINKVYASGENHEQ